MMKRLLLPLLGCAALLGTTALSAQNLTASTTNATVSQQNHTATVTFTPGADSGGFDFVLNYDNTEPASVTTTPGAPSPDITATVANGTISCSATTSTISCIANANASNVDLGTGTVTILFDVGATTGTAALTFGMANFFDQLGGSEAGTTTNGAVNIAAGPTAPQLSFNPASGGSLTISGTGAGTVAVTAGAGTAGQTATLACTSTNGTATVTGSPFAPNTTGSVNVQCAPVVGAPANFTVNCTIDQSVGTDQAAVSFNGVCPGLAAPPAEFNANLSASLIGAPSTVATGSIGISNTGGSPLTITCGAPTAGFTVTSGPTSPVAAGGSTSIGLSCTTPGAAGATATGSLTCTTNDTDEATVVFALSCTAQVLSVPAMGSFGKGIMIALLAGLGLLGFSMRRRAV